MPDLLLVRHSLPAIDSRSPAHEWPLSPEGRERCRMLTEQLAEYVPPDRPPEVIASQEVKAQETAAELSAPFGWRWKTAPNLHEHERRQVSFDDAAGFRSNVGELFARPNKLVFGEETARQADNRFRAAVLDVLDKHPDETVIVVTHGTVLTLFVAAFNPIDPVSFWGRLGLPAFVVLSRPDFQLRTSVMTIEMESETAGNT